MHFGRHAAAKHAETQKWQLPAEDNPLLKYLHHSENPHANHTILNCYQHYVAPWFTLYHVSMSLLGSPLAYEVTSCSRMAAWALLDGTIVCTAASWLPTLENSSSG
jgi:hypothetical protein